MNADVCKFGAGSPQIARRYNRDLPRAPTMILRGEIGYNDEPCSFAAMRGRRNFLFRDVKTNDPAGFIERHERWGGEQQTRVDRPQAAVAACQTAGWG